MPDGMRVQINEGAGLTNTIDNDEFYRLIFDTCIQIENVLIDHCGPYASSSLIIQDNTSYNLKDPHYAIFTKDGINIVKSIEFTSPIQTKIQNLIAYIGSRVESLSHDGTTTSMLFFVRLLAGCIGNLTITQGDLVHWSAEMAAHYHDHPEAWTIPMRRRLTQQMTEQLTELGNCLMEDIITVDRFARHFNLRRKDAIRYIAHTQAMIASKGDKELADAITKYVETLPVELYGLFMIQQTGMETDHRFQVEDDDFDYEIPVATNLDDMNFNMFTEYFHETADMIVSEDDLIRGNPAVNLILDHVFEAKEGRLERDLLIITKSLDGGILEQITHINQANKHKIVIFTPAAAAQYASKNTKLKALMAIAGVYSPTEHWADKTLPYLIKNVRVHYKNKRLYISRLYKKDGSDYHPFYNDPTLFAPYTQMLKEIQSTLHDFASGKIRVETANDKQRHQDYIEIYKRMIQANVRRLLIAGMTHDALADADVLRDALGAVLATLERGFVFDGYLKLFMHAEELKGKWNAILTGSTHAVLESVHRLDALTIGSVDSGASLLVIKLNSIKANRPNNQRSWLRKRPYLYYAIDSDPKYLLREDIDYYLNVVMTSDLKWSDAMPHISLIQPADTYRELFRRCQDLLPKLINTNRAIIPGTVNGGKTS